MNEGLQIILIEDDTDTCRKFVNYTDDDSDIDLIAVTNNSYRALELVKETLPHAIILDLELNLGKGNGILFLQELHKLSLPFKPFILITTNNSSTTMHEYTRQLGADFIMFKHQEDYTEQKAIDFLKMMKDIIQNNKSVHSPGSESYESPDQYNKRINRLILLELDNIGISPKLVGYKYLADAIFYTMNEDSNNICAILGQRYEKTDSSVERAMQNAINKAWRTNDIDNLLENYTAKISSEKGVPTITEFIYYYANKVKSNM